MTTLTRLTRNPLARTPVDDMQRLFDDFMRPLLFSGWEREALSDRPWRPAVDIAETEDHYRLTVELPGLSKEDVEITFESGNLVVRGERSFVEEKGMSYHRMERMYGAFSRSFALPGEVDGDDVEAHFENGLLTVDVPKAEQARPQRIEIR